MSHPFYNPYASRNQSSAQGHYGPSGIQGEVDPRRVGSHLVPGSSLSISGASSVTPSNSGGRIPSVPPQLMNYRTEQSRTIRDENLEMSIERHIGRAREEVRLGQPMLQPIDQGARYPSTERDEFVSSGTGTASYPRPSTSLGLRGSGGESGGSSLDWSSNYTRPSGDDPSKLYSSSASSNFASDTDGRFSASSERNRAIPSIPGLGDFDGPESDKSVASTESSQPKYTSESASNILLQFGLEKEDLEQLISYPENEITPSNLPFILRQIRFEKTKKSTTAAQPKPSFGPEPSRGAGGNDSHSLSSSAGARMHKEEIPLPVLHSSTVIDYGHTSKYTGGVGDEMRATTRSNTGGSGGMSLMDTFEGSRHSREPLQKNLPEFKSSALGSSRDQASSVSSLSSSYSSALSSVAPPSSDQTKRLQTLPNQTFQPIPSSSSLLKKDTDLRLFKSETSKPVPLKQPETDRQSSLNTQPVPSLYQGAHPNRPGLVVIDSNDTGGAKRISQNSGQGSTIVEHVTKQQQSNQQHMQHQQMQQQIPRQQMQMQQQVPRQQMQQQVPRQQMQQQVPRQQMQQQVPLQQMQIQQQIPRQQMQQPQTRNLTASQMPQATWPPAFSATKSVPPPHIPHGIAGTMLRPRGPCPIVIPPAAPRPIPDPMDHMRRPPPSSTKQPPAKVAVSKDQPTAAMMQDYAAATPRTFPHTCCLCSKECTQMKDWIAHQNSSLHLDNCKLLRTRYPEWDGEIIIRPSATGKDSTPSTSAQHGSSSPARSPSPHHRHGSEGSRKSSSQSRSPRYSRRSRSRSPWYDRSTSTRRRSRSRTPERRSPPRRRDDRWSPRRSFERRSSPRWGDARRSPPRRMDERRSPPRRMDERRSPPRRMDERRSPPRRMDERRSPPRRMDERRSPPRRMDERRSPPRRMDERRSPPRRIDERRSPPRRIDQRRSPPRKSGVKRSALWNSDAKQSPPGKSEGKRLPSKASDKRLPTRRSTERPSPQKKKSSSTESLVKKLLETSAIKSLSNPSDLEAVVKSLAPAVLAELAKMKSSASSSSSKGGKPSSSSSQLTKKTPKAKPGLQKSEAGPSKKDQKKPPQKKPATSSVSTPHKKPLQSGAQKASTGKPTGQKGAAKDTVKVLKPITKAKVLVSKAKNISTKPKMAKSGKVFEKGAGKQDLVKQKTSSENQPDVKKVKPKQSETKAQEATVKDMTKVGQRVNLTAVKPEHQEESDKTRGEMETASSAQNQDSKSTTTEAKPVEVEEEKAGSSAQIQEEPTATKTEPMEVGEREAGSSAQIQDEPTAIKTEPMEVGEREAEGSSQIQDEPTTTKTKPVEVGEREAGGSAQIQDEPTATKTEPMEVGEREAGGSTQIQDKPTASKMEPMEVGEREAGGSAQNQEEKPTTTKIGEREAASSAQNPEENLTATKKKPMEILNGKDGSSAQNQEEKPTTTETEPVTVGEVEAGRSTQNQQEKTTITKAEPMEVREREAGSSTQNREEKPMTSGVGLTEVGEMKETTRVEPENSAEKSSESQPPPNPTQPTEASIKAPPYIQQSTSSEPESTVRELTTNEESSHPQKPAVEKEKLQGGGGRVETAEMQEDPVTAAKTQMDTAPANNAAKPVDLTIGEMLKKNLFLSTIPCFKKKTCFSPRFKTLSQGLLLIINLPEYHEGCYTESDLAKQLKPFGFKYTENSIHAVPQTRMAFVQMPSSAEVLRVIKATEKKGLAFKGHTLRFNAIACSIPMKPFWFYNSLMKLLRCQRMSIKNLVFIKNISPSQSQELREALKTICPVKNFMPLLNKVFVEFESVNATDRFGFWCSQLKQAPSYEVYRLCPPNSCGLFSNPVGSSGSPVPSRSAPGTIGPFWVTMRNRPYLFLTEFPSFVIPRHLTVRELDDMKQATAGLAKSPTIMLSDLPEGNYKHNDVAKLVWSHFPKQTLHSLYYNLMVLPLQRRAFVFFPNWTSCCNFVRDHLKNPASVKGHRITVNYVVKDMSPEPSEEMIYTAVMKLSKAQEVPEPESLEERLLCVEISETSLDIINTIAQAVASMATFRSFLSLANRMCFEMADASSVAKVVEKYTKDKAWKKVLRVESVKSLKQRLQDSGDVTITLEPDTVQPEPLDVKCEAQPPVGSAVSESVTTQPNDAVTSDKPGPEITADSAVGSSRAEASSLSDKPESLDVKSGAQPPLSEPSDTGSQPALQTTSEPITAPPSDAVASETPGPEIAMDSTVDPETTEVVEKPEVKGEEASPTTLAVSSGNTVSAASCPPASATELIPQSNLVRLDAFSFQALKAAVRQHRMTMESKSQSSGKEKTNKNKTSSRTTTGEKYQKKAQQDFTDDDPSSDAFLFDDLSMDDFVTVDEVGDDMGDTSPEPHRSSSSKQSSRSRSVRQSSDVSSSDRRTSTRSRDSKRSTSSSSSSSKSNKGSNSSETTKSPSASVTKSTPSSSRSTFEKTQQSKIKSPAKASNAASSGCSTQSSSSVHDTERIKSAAADKAPMERCSESPNKGEKDPKSLMAKSNHKVSAEDLAAKPVEVETKTKRSPKMHPPLQGLGLELSQSQRIEMDSNVNTVTEEGRVDSVGQKDKPKIDGTEDCISVQPTVPGRGRQALHEESSQVDEGIFCLEDGAEMEIDGSFQVLDSVTEDEPATCQDDSHLVQDAGSPVELLMEDVIPSSDNLFTFPEGKDQQANIAHDSQVLDACSASKEVENSDGQIPNEDLPPQDPNDTIKDLENDLAEQETFQILDSTDDPIATEDESQNQESIVNISEDYIGLMVEGGDMYQVIDSVEDQPITIESETGNKGKGNMRGKATVGKDDKPKRSHPTTKTSKSEEMEKSPEKKHKVKKYETRRSRDTAAGVSGKDEGITEEMVFEILDSVEEEPVTTERAGRRRSARGKKEDKVDLTAVPEKPEEATYEILDFVEDHTANDEPTITTRSTRGKREKTVKEAAEKRETPTRRRHSPVRELQEENQKKSPKKDVKSTSKSTAEDTTYEVLDSLEDGAGQCDRPRRTGKRGRPKKEVMSTKCAALKKDEEDVSEEEAAYQILDSVEDEVVDDLPATGHSNSERQDCVDGQPTDERASNNELEGEEPMYQVIDSLEDDQIQETVEDKTKDETPTKEEPSETCGTTELVESLCQVAHEEVNNDPSEAEALGITEGEPKEQLTTMDNSTRDCALFEKQNKPESPDKHNSASALDEVSEEEEDYPDDAAEEEELRKQQAAAKQKQLVKAREVRRTMGRGRRSGRSKEEEEVDPKELVTLDEVGAEEAGEDSVSESREWVGQLMEAELQALVTLDEFVEEDEDGKDEQTEPCPPIQEDESVDFLNPETLVTLDEAGDEEEEKLDEEQDEKTCGKRKHGDMEESMNFLTVDEVGELEEEEEKKAVKPRTRGRAKKRARQTPVRKSTRGSKVTANQREEEELLPSAPPVAGDGQMQIQGSEVDVHVDASSADQKPQTPDEYEQEGEGWSRMNIKAASKRRAEPVAPEAKRSRSQSPCAAIDVKLPPFKPNNPLGQQFVVPKSGFFCNLCSVFYLNESAAKEMHCSSQRHYDNLQKHYQKTQQEASRSSQGSVSDSNC